MIRIPIRGMSKARPRVTGRSTYMPKRYTDWKKNFRILYKIFGDNKNFGTKPVRMEIIFQFEIPKSYSRKQRDNLDHTKISQDVDNSLGACMDALNGVAYKDDRQVVELTGRKMYGNENCIYLKIEEAK